MAIPVDPEDPVPEPGDPGYYPPTEAGTVLAFVVYGTSFTITSEQITAAGGPWAAFTVKVTPANDYGSGASQEVDLTAVI